MGIWVLAATLSAASAGALGIRQEEVLTRYREVLELLAQGERDQAMESLFALETEAVGELLGTVELERYWRLKLKVIREVLQGGQLDQLIPIVVMHHDAYLMYRERRQPLLAGHTRTMAAELAETLAKKHNDPGIQQFSSWVLTSFAVYMQESRSISSSAMFLEQALDYAPGNRVALLALAAAHEKYGEYGAAVPFLEKAVSRDAEDHESRLRLAICLRRLEGREVPERHLKKLIEPGPPEWIRVLAFEELARLYHEEGATAEAHALLERAIGELPEHQQLRIQAAAYLELDRRPKEAARLLDGLEAQDAAASSPRYIYDRWPHDGIEQIRGSMRSMMNGRLGLLAEGLRGSSQTGMGS